MLHQNGADVPMKRLDDAEVKRRADEAAAKTAFAAQRYKDQKQAPGSEEALRRVIGEVRAGEPKYNRMSAEAAQRTTQQLPRLKETIGKLGALQSVSFIGVLPDGTDDYVVKFANGDTEWRIMMAPDGKIQTLGYHPL
jgi:hypothetical protein